MTEYLKPLPKSDPLTAPFWESLRKSQIEIQRCDDCGSHIFYPRGLCTNCGSRALRWTPVSGRGRIYSFTIVHRPPSAAFKADAPYIVALIELDEGCRMMSNVIDVEPDPAKVKIGMPVEIAYDQVTAEVTLPKFRLAKG